MLVQQKLGFIKRELEVVSAKFKQLASGAQRCQLERRIGPRRQDEP